MASQGVCPSALLAARINPFSRFQLPPSAALAHPFLPPTVGFRGRLSGLLAMSNRSPQCEEPRMWIVTACVCETFTRLQQQKDCF